MPYVRPRPSMALSRGEKDQLISEYFQLYRKLAAADPSAAELNIKVPREAFAGLLDEIGALLIQRAGELASNPGPVRDFLEEHAPPGALARLLPAEFRAFCLALNAFKQWVAAEQGATDRFLLGGTARPALRKAADVCTLTGQPINDADVELHHPVRDGRPPIPVSKTAHAKLEKQAPAGVALADSPEERLLALRRRGNRSWVMLRRGCLDLLGKPVSHSTPDVGASSRSFARQAMETTGKDCTWLLAFLDERGLGSKA